MCKYSDWIPFGKPWYYKMGKDRDKDMELLLQIDELANKDLKSISDLITNKEGRTFLGLGLNKPGTEVCIFSKNKLTGCVEECVYKVDGLNETSFDPDALVMKYRVPLENVSN